MLLHRVLSATAAAAAVLVLQTAVPAHALSTASVCSFATGKLYVRDASQTSFPPGFRSCVGADGKAIARCASCKCRDKQAGTTNGLSVEWGLCVEGTEACVTAQTPDREYCGNDTERGRSFEPGTVTSANTDGAVVSAPMATSPGGVEELGSGTSISNGASSSKSSANTYIVSGCAVTGVAAVAMFTVSRRRQTERELGTPEQDLGPVYDHNNTSKAKPLSDSTISYKNRLSERMTGESILDDTTFHPAHPVALPVPATISSGGSANYNTQQPQRAPQAAYAAAAAGVGAAAAADPSARPAADSMARDSSFFGFEEDDERFTIEDGSVSERSGFGSLAYGKNSSTMDFGASLMSVDSFGASSATVDFGATTRSEASMLYGVDRDTSLSVELDGLTMFERDTAASEFMRESDDSVVFAASSSSSLSFYAEDEKSPRKSIEF